MDPDRWREIRVVFDQLVALQPDARAVRLAAVGATDSDLRREVEALLRADAGAAARVAKLTRVFIPPDDAQPADPLGLSGRSLAHFRVLEPLGSGGMGAVYSAEDTRLGRVVALKLPLPTQRLDSSSRARFLQEARSVATLDHPNLCTVYEAGEGEDGLLYLAMALYHGETLRTRLAHAGALPVQEALGIARQIARGLAAAHEAGIVHRDLKPANVMLLPDGAVKILDFGLAKVRDLSLTGSGMLLGTAAYMSPEQIRGDRVDGRSDLWSLGVVLYEMLTGRQPFGGENAVAVAHAIVHTEAAPPSRHNPGVAAVDEIVLSLLEKQPGRRLDTGHAADAALASVEHGRRPRRAAAARRWLRVHGRQAAVAALIAGSAGFAVYRGLRPPPDRFEPNLLAVAPFEVADTSLQLWREGLVDILSLDLDGAGPLRTVPQTTVLKRWSGRSDRSSAERLARRTGAELVVFGHVSRRGPDSIGVRAAVLDRSRGIVETDVEVMGEERRMGEVVDSLGIRVLRRLGHSRAIGGHPHQSVGSRSLGALKEFLRGEQFFRRGLYDSALTRYERAFLADSTFVLALRRMQRVVAWRPASSAVDPSRLEYLRRATPLNRGLSRRDSALLTADSFQVAASGARSADELLSNIFARTRTLEELSRRYPDDPEVWYLLGDVRVHGGPPLGGFPGPALAAFERAISLDAGFAPAYEHVLELSFQTGHPERAGEYARTYPALNGAGLDAESFRLVVAILDSGGVHSSAIVRRRAGASVNTLVTAAREHLKWSTDSAESAVVLLQDVLQGVRDISDAPPPAADSLMWRQYLASALAFRGRLHAAVEAHGTLLAESGASRLSPLEDPFEDLALLGTITDSLARTAYEPGLSPASDWRAPYTTSPPRFLRGLAWWMSRRDTAAIHVFARRARAAVREAQAPRAVLRGRYYAAAAQAYLTLARGDSAGAARLLLAIPDTLCVVGGCYPEKLRLARLLEARGDDREAAAILDRWWNAGSPRPSAVLAALMRARIAERLGDGATALERYRFVSQVWRNADPALRDYVRQARAGERRLSGTL